MNLKEAIAKGKLSQFIKERLEQAGDQPKFDSALSSMTKQKSKEVLAASPKDSDES